ncbi:MAG TPA: DUF3106 domain-containing protein [Candidatus Acidoferrum sp.]|nr:DUF3106 domain-containing protein [Candidatus Acidoferrum sp.]
MTKRLQSGILLTALSSALFCGAAFAQSTHPDRPPQRQQAPPPKSNTGGNRPPAQSPNANRLPRQNPQPNRNADRPQNPPPRTQSVDRPNARQNPPQFDRSPRNDNRPPSAGANPNHANGLAPGNAGGRSGNSYDRPNNAYSDRPGFARGNGERAPARQKPFVDQMRDLTPQERDGVLQKSRTFQNLAPDQQNRIRNQFSQWDRMSSQQRADLREKENTWRNLTPQQRDYIKNDVMPRWRQVPWQRQQVIQQKLGVLQNMPESARNRRLSDPNFTRGMSDEDRSMLHDLSHLHVGGAPDPPSNEP